MLLLWCLILMFNAYFAFILAGTWQGIVSVMFAAFSLFYIIQHLRNQK